MTLTVEVRDQIEDCQILTDVGDLLDRVLSFRVDRGLMRDLLTIERLRSYHGTLLDGLEGIPDNKIRVVDEFEIDGIPAAEIETHEFVVDGEIEFGRTYER